MRPRRACRFVNRRVFAMQARAAPPAATCPGDPACNVRANKNKRSGVLPLAAPRSKRCSPTTRAARQNQALRLITEEKVVALLGPMTAARPLFSMPSPVSFRCIPDRFCFGAGGRRRERVFDRAQRSCSVAGRLAAVRAAKRREQSQARSRAAARATLSCRTPQQNCRAAWLNILIGCARSAVRSRVTRRLA
jgi:hypothetical protein